MAGCLPLILFGGRFWPAMATAIAGDVFGSAILALYFAPSLFAAIARRNKRRTRARVPERVVPTGARALVS